METLFSDRSWYEIEQRLHENLKSDVNNWDGNQLLSRSVNDLCKDFVKKYQVDIPIINRNEIKKDYEDMEIDVNGDPKYTTNDQSRPAYVQGIRIEISVPYTGKTAAFWWKPTTHTLNPPRAIVSNSGEYLILVIIGTNLEEGLGCVYIL